MLVRTCSDTDREFRSAGPSDWTTMLCGGTVIPVSVVSCSGPASVKMSTATSAGWLLTFIRYSRIRPAVCWPGPANQKSVPGLPQAAVGSPVPVVCSTSSPCASGPVAWMTTPPRITVAAIVWLAGCCWVVFVAGPGLVFLVPCFCCAVLATRVWSVAILASRGAPGWLTVSTRPPGAALLVPDSRLTTAVPLPARRWRPGAG